MIAPTLSSKINFSIKEYEIPILPEAKAEWIAALRSGDYEKTVGSLRIGDGFCCLGVASDLFIKKNKAYEWEPTEDREIIDKGRGARILCNGRPSTSGTPAYLLSFVQVWLCGCLHKGKTDREEEWQSCLAQLNDSGVNFNQIADVIERGVVYEFNNQSFATREEAEREEAAYKACLEDPKRSRYP